MNGRLYRAGAAAGTSPLRKIRGGAKEGNEP